MHPTPRGRAWAVPAPDRDQPWRVVPVPPDVLPPPPMWRPGATGARTAQLETSASVASGQVRPARWRHDRFAVHASGRSDRCLHRPARGPTTSALRSVTSGSSLLTTRKAGRLTGRVGWPAPGSHRRYKTGTGNRTQRHTPSRDRRAETERRERYATAVITNEPTPGRSRGLTRLDLMEALHGPVGRVESDKAICSTPGGEDHALRMMTADLGRIHGGRKCGTWELVVGH